MYSSSSSYRRVPSDLMTEPSTIRGSILSVIVSVIMGTLFVLETKAYFSTSLTTNMTVDSNEDPQIRLNFDITMLDLPCQYATLDLFSDLGDRLNVTENIRKNHVDAAGKRQLIEHRNWHQNDVELWDPAVSESVEDLHADGQDAITLNGNTLKTVKDQFPFLFVNFHANWCAHCKDFGPTWEVVGEIVTYAAMAKVEDDLQRRGIVDSEFLTDEQYEHAVNVAAPVLITKLDCAVHPDVCTEEGIRAYPTMRAYVHGVARGEYDGHRTVVEIVDWMIGIENATMGGANADILEDVKDRAAKRTIRTDEEARWAKGVSNSNRVPSRSWNDDVDASMNYNHRHPGCRLSGHVLVDRAPGNFHIQSRSYGRNLAAHMTNVSHVVHHLSFGKPEVQTYIESVAKEGGGGGAFFSPPPGFAESMHPMDGNMYVTGGLHQAHHHYLKVVSTEFVDSRSDFFGNDYAQKKRIKKMTTAHPRAYRILQSSQLSLYKSDVVPEAKFSYDLSPIAISYQVGDSCNWYDYLTAVMAIIGGTFTVIGMMESGLASLSPSVFSGRRKQYC